MSVNDELGTRMKEYYEIPPRSKLTRRTPVIIRVDGKAFHTFTRGFRRPFDSVLVRVMQETTKYLCENIQGCVLGYVQSDEISLLLTDYKRHTSSAWFDYDVMKLCSISASMATNHFNKLFRQLSYIEIDNEGEKFYQKTFGKSENELTLAELDSIDPNCDYYKLARAYDKANFCGAMFDSRCFNIPKEEVTNYFYWRQLDATRNSIEMAGHANFSQKQLHKKSCNDIQEMLYEQKGINWNDYTVPEKRGTCCIKVQKEATNDNGRIYTRSEWIIDYNIPIFVGEGREYVESRFMNIEED